MSTTPAAVSAGSTGCDNAYLNLLNWAVVVFSSTRLLTCVPTLWAIHCTGDSSPHSLLTWLAWLASNASLAAWLYETNGRRVNKLTAVAFGNGLVCLITCVAIVCYR